jgi:hypothetical protein
MNSLMRKVDSLTHVLNFHWRIDGHRAAVCCGAAAIMRLPELAAPATLSTNAIVLLTTLHDPVPIKSLNNDAESKPQY